MPLPIDLDHFFQQPVSLLSLEFIRIDLPQKEVFRSGIGERRSRQALLVKWTDMDGAVGFGECSCRPDVAFSHEYLAGAEEVIRRFIFPHLPFAKTVGEVEKVLGKVRGWPFTRAAVEMAMINLLRAKDAWSLQQAWQGDSTDRIPVGISLGLQESWAQLGKSLQRFDEGYCRIKFKIHPDSPVDPFRKLLPAVSDRYVAFDANGTFGLDTMDKLRAFAALGRIIEQPFPPGRNDLLLQARQNMPDLKVCLDEEVVGFGDLVTAHKLGLLDELNLKPGRIGGLLPSLQMITYCRQYHIPCWVGGMFETGIGRSFNLQIASLLPEAGAHDLSPSSRYFESDIVRPDIEMQPDGTILLEDVLAVQPDEGQIRTFTTSSQTPSLHV